MVSPLQTQYLRLYCDRILPQNLFGRLLRQFRTLASLTATGPELLAESGYNPGLLIQVFSGLNQPPRDTGLFVEQVSQWLEDSDQRHLLCFEETGYPPLLRETACPPPLLFVDGQVELLCQPQLAVVGSRKASPQGKQLASWFAAELVAAGFCITSGLAAGIDSESHRGALSAGGTTLAILGTGIDRVYPARNRQLAGQIKTSGALISEFPLGTPPLPANFPRRNRLIAGLSLGVLVVEAAPRSGSLITARLAMEANREVFAVPGSIASGNSKGCHQLIRDGAKLVDSLDAILEELQPSEQKTDATGIAQKQLCTDIPATDSIGSAEKMNRECQAEPHRLPDSLTPDEALLVSSLGQDPCPADLLARRTGLSIERVSRLLTGLELKGLLTQSGGRFHFLSTGLQAESD